jgi:hypothetical protein
MLSLSPEIYITSYNNAAVSRIHSLTVLYFLYYMYWGPNHVFWKKSVFSVWCLPRNKRTQCWWNIIYYATKSVLKSVFYNEINCIFHKNHLFGIFSFFISNLSKRYQFLQYFALSSYLSGLQFHLFCPYLEVTCAKFIWSNRDYLNLAPNMVSKMKSIYITS